MNLSSDEQKRQNARRRRAWDKQAGSYDIAVGTGPLLVRVVELMPQHRSVTR